MVVNKANLALEVKDRVKGLDKEDRARWAMEAMTNGTITAAEGAGGDGNPTDLHYQRSVFVPLDFRLDIVAFTLNQSGFLIHPAGV